MEKFTHEEVLKKYEAIEDQIKDALSTLYEFTCEVSAFGVENDPTPPVHWMNQDIDKTRQLLASQLWNLKMTLHARKVKNVR